MKDYGPNKPPEPSKLAGDDIEIRVENGFTNWFSNFWYYNKWKVLIAVFAVILLTVTTVQMCRNTEEDLTLLYAGSSFLVNEKQVAIREAFASVMPEDFNGDGELICGLSTVNVYSNEQIAEIKELAASDTSVIPVNGAYNAQQLSSFDNLIAAGEYKIILVEPWLYERVASSGGIRKLTDVLGELPETAYSEFAVKFMDTAFAKAHPEAFEGLPPDLLICLRTSISIGSVLNGNSSGEYAQQEKMFRAIVNAK